MMVWFRWFSGFQLGEFRFQPLIFPGCKPVMHCYGWSTRRKSSAFWGYQRLKEEAAIPTSGYKSQMRHPMRGVQQHLVDFCGFSSQLNIPFFPHGFHPMHPMGCPRILETKALLRLKPPGYLQIYITCLDLAKSPTNLQQQQLPCDFVDSGLL